jgi:hypothetical protein
MFSCFALPDSFSAVPRASGPVFMFCASGLVFGGSEGVGSRFHVLRPRTRFWRYRGCRVPFSCCALPDSFLAVRRAYGPVFVFCAPGLVFGGTDSVRSRFHVLHSRTRRPRFRRYRQCGGRRVPFLCFVLPDSFSAVPRASGPVFMFCVPALVLGDTEGVGSCFHVLRIQTSFRQCGGRRVRFSCFALPDTFSAVPRASDPVFMFCAPGLIFGGTAGVGSRFHVLHARNHFRRYRRRPLSFSFFALPVTFSVVRRASGPVFMFCIPVLVFGDNEGVGSRFHVLRSWNRFWRCGGRRLLFSCFSAPGLIFGGSEGVGSCFHVLCSWTRFRRFRGRRVQFSCFALLNSFSAIPRASGPIFMFCAPGLVFGGSEGVGSRFHVLRPRTRFRRYRGRRVQFSCFASPYPFLVIPRASGPVFMFCAPGLIFGGS